MFNKKCSPSPQIFECGRLLESIVKYVRYSSSIGTFSVISPCLQSVRMTNQFISFRWLVILNRLTTNCGFYFLFRCVSKSETIGFRICFEGIVFRGQTSNTPNADFDVNNNLTRFSSPAFLSLYIYVHPFLFNRKSIEYV